MDAKKRTILLVDDEPHVVRVIKMILEKAGYAVTVAYNGLQATEALENFTPDALITDCDMPKMSGQQLCAWIVEHRPSRAYPIYVQTSLTGLEQRDWTAKIDNLVFMEKPLNGKRLISDLNAYFEQTLS